MVFPVKFSNKIEENKKKNADNLIFKGKRENKTIFTTYFKIYDQVKINLTAKQLSF